MKLNFANYSASQEQNIFWKYLSKEEKQKYWQGYIKHESKYNIHRNDIIVENIEVENTHNLDGLTELTWLDNIDIVAIMSFITSLDLDKIKLNDTEYFINQAKMISAKFNISIPHSSYFLVNWSLT